MKLLKPLIQACIKGNRQSQNELYKQFVSKMFAVCLRYSKNREEGEEILQEGFMQVFKSLNKFRHEGSFEGWIRKIMVYSAILHYRKLPKMHPVVSIDMREVEMHGDESTIQRLGEKELLKMVQALPAGYRMVFNLFVFEGMKHREIAEHLGISEGTSKSNLFDARRVLRRAVNNSIKVAKLNY